MSKQHKQDISLARSSPTKNHNRRGLISLRDLVRCIRSVQSVTTDIDQQISNGEIPNEITYRNYIENQGNIYITDKDLGLDTRIKGAVFKRKSNNSQIGKFMYMIYMSPKVKDPIKRVFTLSHEFAHVQLHGSLMQTGMSLNLSSQNWETDGLAMRLIETEANIFAMMTTIPNRIIEDARSHDLSNIEAVQWISSRINTVLGRNGVTTNLIKDRLLVHRLSQYDTWDVSLEDAVYTTRIRSWIAQDTNFSGSSSPLFN